MVHCVRVIHTQGYGKAKAVRISKSVFHAPREAHPVIDTLAQGMLFESQAKFERMQAFLDRKKK